MRSQLITLLLLLSSITRIKPLERHDDITYGSFGSYLSSSEIQEYLETYEATHENARVFSYGKSLKNVSLWGICIGETCNNSSISRPQALFTSLIHSREPMALMALTDGRRTEVAPRSALPRQGRALRSAWRCLCGFPLPAARAAERRAAPPKRAAAARTSRAAPTEYKV